MSILEISSSTSSLLSCEISPNSFPREAEGWDTGYLPLGYVLARRREGEEARKGMAGSVAAVEGRLERLLEKSFLATDPDTWPVKVVMARNEEGELRPFVKILETGGVKFKTDGGKMADKAKEENVEGKEEKEEGKGDPKDKNIAQVC